MALSSTFSPRRINGCLLLHYLLEFISLRIPWDCVFRYTNRKGERNLKLLLKYLAHNQCLQIRHNEYDSLQQCFTHMLTPETTSLPDEKRNLHSFCVEGVVVTGLTEAQKVTLRTLGAVE